MFRPMTMCIGIPTVDAATAGISYGSVALLSSDVSDLPEIMMHHVYSSDPSYKLATLDYTDFATLHYGEPTVPDLRDDINHTPNFDLLILGGLDYLEPERGYTDEPSFVSVCRELKGIAREHDIGILAIGSSRVGIANPLNDDWMGMVDLAMTLQVADGDQSSLVLDIIKNRHGPAGTLELAMRDGRLVEAVLS